MPLKKYPFSCLLSISVPTFNPLSVAQAGVRRRGPHLLMPASVGSLTADPPVLSSFAAHHPIPFQCAPSPSIWECCVAGSDGVQYALGPEARCCLRFEALPHCLGEGMALPPPPHCVVREHCGVVSHLRGLGQLWRCQPSLSQQRPASVPGIAGLGSVPHPGLNGNPRTPVDGRGLTTPHQTFLTAALASQESWSPGTRSR